MLYYHYTKNNGIKLYNIDPEKNFLKNATDIIKKRTYIVKGGRAEWMIRI